MVVVVNELTPVNWSCRLVFVQQLLCKKLVGIFSFYKLAIAIHEKYHVRRENLNWDWKTFITWLSYCLFFLTFQGHEEIVCVYNCHLSYVILKMDFQVNSFVLTSCFLNSNVTCFMKWKFNKNIEINF